LSDAIVDGETGILVEPKNVTELAQAIDKVSSDGKLRSMLGVNAKCRVLQYFSSDVVNRLLIDEYANLLNCLRK
jgi:glycosyltransferase involved in cell wall biosynthesis